MGKYTIATLNALKTLLFALFRHHVFFAYFSRNNLHTYARAYKAFASKRYFNAF